MSIIHLPNGIGDTLGDSLVTSSPLEVNGNVWYVNSATGSDAASPAGQNRQAPLATLGQANTNAANGDIIVLMDGHAETFTASLSISKDLTIVGAGSSGGLPTVKLTNNSAAASLLSITSAFCQLRNIWIEEQTQACSAQKIAYTNAAGSLYIDGCYIQCGQYDDVAALYFQNAEVVSIRNTTFISTATSIATQPHSAIDADAAASVHALIMDGVVVDGGTYGWSNYHAIDLAGSSITNVAIENMSLLRGSDMKIHSSAVGYVSVPTKTGGCRIDWDGVT